MPLTQTQVQENRSETVWAFWARLFWWMVFAAAFGYVEAAVVVYLRRATGMAPRLDYPTIFRQRGADFGPVGILKEMQRQGVLSIELCREAATILLLVGAAWAAGRTRREKWGIFGCTFALWDLTYYLFLALWIGFPHQLTDTDIYFLIPFAWYGPVWFPILVFMPILLFLSVRLLRKEAQL